MASFRISQARVRISGWALSWSRRRKKLSHPVAVTSVLDVGVGLKARLTCCLW